MRRPRSSVLLLCQLGLLACGGSGTEAPTPPTTVLGEPLPDLDPMLVERIEAARAAVRAAPQAADRWGELGLVYHANFLPANAVPCYETAERLDPADARWPYQRSVALADLGSSTEALEALRVALAREPERAAFHWHVGETLLELGDGAGAEQAFAETIRLAPAASAGWSGRAHARLERGDGGAALEDLDRALQLAPHDAYVHHLRAIALRLLGRESEAAREQELGAGAHPGWMTPLDDERGKYLVVTLAVRRKVAQELYDAGRLEEAVKVLEGLTPELAQDLPHLRFLGRAYLRVGRVQEALDMFRRCIALAPEDRNSLVGLAEAELRAGLEDDALTTLERTIALHPGLGAPYHFLGVLRENRGDAPGAIAAFKKCLELDQRNAPTHLALGRLLLDRREWSEAAATYERALQAGVDDGDVYVGLAKARLMLDDLEGAESALAASRTRRTSDTALQRKVESALREARNAPRGS